LHLETHADHLLTLGSPASITELLEFGLSTSVEIDRFVASALVAPNVGFSCNRITVFALGNYLGPPAAGNRSLLSEYGR